MKSFAGQYIKIIPGTVIQAANGRCRLVRHSTQLLRLTDASEHEEKNKKTLADTTIQDLVVGWLVATTMTRAMIPVSMAILKQTQAALPFVRLMSRVTTI